jgi:RHS repeat-associated protein
MTKSVLRAWLKVATGLLMLSSVACASASTTKITIGGSEQFALPSIWDAGSFSLTVNGHTESIAYAQYSTAQSVASGLAVRFSLDCTSPVTAYASGTTITFTTKLSDETFEQISSMATWNTATFSHSSFDIPQSQTTTASPTPSLNLSCTPNPVPAGGSADCTAELPKGVTGVVSFSIDSQPSWSTATVDGSGWAPASTLSGLQSGNHALSASYSGDSNYNATSQVVSVQVDSGALASTSLYSYSITMPDNVTSGYQANGNIQAYTDSVNGQWGRQSGTPLQYDNLNRLIGANVTSISGATQFWCWAYDSFGNRTTEASSASSFSSCPNQIMPAANNQLPGPLYDAAGNITFDGINQYLYDGDGRICAMGTRMVTGGTMMVEYIYNADGNRVAKGNITAFSCDSSSNGFTPTNSYVLDQDGHQVTEMAIVAGQPAWMHTNVYAGGMLLATYDPQGLHFQLTDWLGSRRVQTNAFGQVEETCSNSPFGNGLNCSNPLGAPSTADDATEHHFTGKERDTESGLDYFGARYYGSSMGRFIGLPDLLNQIVC